MVAKTTTKSEEVRCEVEAVTPPQVRKRFLFNLGNKQHKQQQKSQKHLSSPSPRRRLKGGPPSSFHPRPSAAPTKKSVRRVFDVTKSLAVVVDVEEHVDSETPLSPHSTCESSTSTTNNSVNNGDGLSLEDIIGCSPTLASCITLMQSQYVEECRSGLLQLKQLFECDHKSSSTSASSFDLEILCHTLIYGSSNSNNKSKHSAEYKRVRFLLSSFLCDDVLMNIDNLDEEGSTDDETVSQENDDRNETVYHEHWNKQAEKNVDDTENSQEDSVDDAEVDIESLSLFEIANMMMGINVKQWQSNGLVNENEYDNNDDDDEDDGLQGRCWGVLSSLALEILIIALERVASVPRSISHKRMDFSPASCFWRPILTSLSRNIENMQPATMDVCASSIQCLLLLHQMEPSSMQLHLQGSLLPYIVEAQEQGEALNHLKLEYSAFQLLQAAQRNSTERDETHCCL